MRELLRTNDPVLLSFVGSLLRDAGILAFVADNGIAGVEGSIGILPRRMLVSTDDLEAARRLLRDADLGQWVTDDGRG